MGQQVIRWWVREESDGRRRQEEGGGGASFVTWSACILYLFSDESRPHSEKLFSGWRTRLISLNGRWGRVGGAMTCILSSLVFVLSEYSHTVCCAAPTTDSSVVPSLPVEERVLKTERWQDWGRQESVEVEEANAVAAADAAAESVKDEERESAGTNKIKFSPISRLIEPRASLKAEVPLWGSSGGRS